MTERAIRYTRIAPAPSCAPNWSASPRASAMPTDLLRYISGPTPYATLWMVLAGLLGARPDRLVRGLYVWTLPPATLRNLRVDLAAAPPAAGAPVLPHHRRHHRPYRAGAHQRGAGVRAATAAPCAASCTWPPGSRPNTCTPPTWRASLAPAAPLIDALNDARFTPAPRADVERLGASVRGDDPVVDLKWWPITLDRRGRAAGCGRAWPRSSRCPPSRGCCARWPRSAG